MLRRSRKNKKYSAELKMKAVQSYLNGECGLWTVCKKYGILNEKQLRNRGLWDNGHREFKERTSAKGVYLHNDRISSHT